MDERSIDWMIIDRFDKPIGALGFVGNRVAIVTAFYDDRDGDKSGDLSVGERAAGFFMGGLIEGSAVAEVAMAARVDMAVIERDAGFAQEAVNIWLNFAANAIKEGIYIVYMSRGVKAAAGAVAKQIGGNAVREFAIRKGMEKVVKDLYDAAVSP
jgi:hypothetical protein